MTRILFIEESWQGSCARSMREALTQLPGVEIADLAEDRFIPFYRHLATRLANRVLRPLHLWELRTAVRKALCDVRPEALVVYKGSWIDAGLVEEARDMGVRTVNVYPDYSPHAYGHRHRRALGAYDLVVSSKPFHPPLWKSVYGYDNPCVCVPHGYDPKVHLWTGPADEAAFDVALCASWRPEYHQLVIALAAELRGATASVAISGKGWAEHRTHFPGSWTLIGPKTGRAYGEFLRSARLAIAPVNREVVIRGVRQPGDEDTTRTYELAAAHCFFLHQRTDHVATVYDPETEVPLWSDARELAELLRRWLPDEAGRRKLAAAAHARAVPAYSLQRRAAAVLQEIEGLLGGQGPSGGG